MTGGKRAPGLPKFDPNRGVCFRYHLLCDLPANISRRCTAVSPSRFSSLYPPSADLDGRSRNALLALARIVRTMPAPSLETRIWSMCLSQSRESSSSRRLRSSTPMARRTPVVTHPFSHSPRNYIRICHLHPRLSLLCTRRRTLRLRSRRPRACELRRRQRQPRWCEHN